MQTTESRVFKALRVSERTVKYSSSHCEDDGEGRVEFRKDLRENVAASVVEVRLADVDKEVEHDQHGYADLAGVAYVRPPDFATHFTDLADCSDILRLWTCDWFDQS